MEVITFAEKNMIYKLLNAARDWLKSRRKHKYCWTCRKRTGDQRCKSQR